MNERTKAFHHRTQWYKKVIACLSIVLTHVIVIRYESFRLYYGYLQDDQSRLLRFNIAIFITLILAGHC